VPVEDRVAAIFFPIRPLLPIPVTITRPRQSSSISTAASNSGPMRSISE